MADGTALLTIAPSFAFVAPTFTVNGTYLPFASVAVGTTSNPFVSTPTAYTAFNSQNGSVSTFAIDSVQIDFVNTQSAINVQGKLTASCFY